MPLPPRSSPPLAAPRLVSCLCVMAFPQAAGAGRRCHLGSGWASQAPVIPVQAEEPAYCGPAGVPGLWSCCGEGRAASLPAGVLLGASRVTVLDACAVWWRTRCGVFTQLSSAQCGVALPEKHRPQSAFSPLEGTFSLASYSLQSGPGEVMACLCRKTESYAGLPVAS